MARNEFGTLGDLSTVTAGSGVGIAHLEAVCVTVTFSGAYDASSVDIEFGFGTFWYKPGIGTFKTSTFTQSGSLEVPPGVQSIRANMTVANGATAYVRYGGRDNDRRS